MKNDIYLMVNDKKIELPEKVLEDIRKSLEVKDLDEKIIDEFYGMLNSRYHSLEKNKLKVVVGEYHYSGERFLTIELPNCNEDWTFGVYETCKEFVKGNDYRYPTHYAWQSPTKFYIHLEDK